jgi:hypothetical protein
MCKYTLDYITPIYYENKLPFEGLLYYKNLPNYSLMKESLMYYEKNNFNIIQLTEIRSKSTPFSKSPSTKKKSIIS